MQVGIQFRAYFWACMFNPESTLRLIAKWDCIHKPSIVWVTCSVKVRFSAPSDLLWPKKTHDPRKHILKCDNGLDLDLAGWAPQLGPGLASLIRGHRPSPAYLPRAGPRSAGPLKIRMKIICWPLGQGSKTRWTWWISIKYSDIYKRWGPLRNCPDQVLTRPR